ncbi:MAG: hypothetical protein HN368_02045 [Spirochaetales bacterium]|nr:hypothetical protein [Spirochaetales bacterium]
MAVSLSDGLFNGDRLSVDAAVDLNQEGLSLDSLNISYLTNQIRNASGTLTFADGTASASGDFFGTFRDQILSSKLRFNGNFINEISRLTLSEALKADFGGLITFDNIKIGPEGFEPWFFDIAQEDRILTVAGRRENLIDAVIPIELVIANDRSFTITLMSPLPVSGTARGVIVGGDIEASIQIDTLDMEGMESILVIPFFNITSGTARGTLQVSGQLNDPDIYGDLQGRDLLANIEVVPEIIGPFNAKLSFKGKQLLINKTLFRIGEGSVEGEADFTMDHWLPRSYRIDLLTVDAPGIHVRKAFGKVDVDGFAEGSLLVVGDPVSIELSGTLTASDATVIIGDKPPPRDRTNTPVIADIRVNTGTNVEFLWPTRNVPILNAIVDTDQTLAVKSDPLAGTLKIEGNIAVMRGQVYYLQRNFRITEGSVWLQEDENVVDPHITVRAERRDRTDEDKDLRIFLVIENQPFSKFSPSFETIPSMSQADIWAHLGQDLRNELTGEYTGLESALLLGSDLLSQFTIMRTFEQRVREVFNLDLFSIRTHILQNLIGERLLTGPDTTPSISRYLDNTTLFLGKYFGNDIFIEAMVRLRTNQALLLNLNAGDDLSVESEITFELKTPLFLLELSLLPNFLDPLSSITRARLGLSWNFSY